MAPQNQLGKRVKLTQVRRPFIVGSTAKPFSDTNPRPAGVPDTHTHSWQVFVKGLDDTDITYWLRRVQFKLHESIPNYVRMVEGEPGKPFVVEETGWEEKQAMIASNGEIRAWSYEEQLFNEPYEVFYNLLTQGAVPKGWKPSGGKGKGKTRAPPPFPTDSNEVWEHSAMIPAHNRPGQPFSLETEAAEIRKLADAQTQAEDMAKRILAELKAKEELLAKLKGENQAAAAAAKS
ncbi:hypothetical protein FoTM2_003619 [Fusarium oxysporum f. sp. vasinfectum]|nr:hypothetical protein FoTM2_003619 [Fusarium oxysporum f. sp. vasinfectum]